MKRVVVPYKNRQIILISQDDENFTTKIVEAKKPTVILGPYYGQQNASTKGQSYIDNLSV